MSNTTQTIAVTAEQRLDALTHARAAFPELDIPQLMTIVNWALDGSTLLDLDAVEIASKTLAKEQGINWNYHVDTSNKFVGLAARTVTAYFAAIRR
jgi:hypothetical protein